jgi:hypothetical protein
VGPGVAEWERVDTRAEVANANPGHPRILGPDISSIGSPNSRTRARGLRTIISDADGASSDGRPDFRWTHYRDQVPTRSAGKATSHRTSERTGVIEDMQARRAGA